MKHPREIYLIMAYMFKHQECGWTYVYMVEVKLDAPIMHLFNGGDGLVVHGGNGSRRYAKHWDDPEWLVVHCEDEDFIAMGITDEEATAFVQSCNPDPHDIED